MKKTATKKIVENTIPTQTIEMTKSFPTMSSFTIKATIPTGAYSNISPEMTFNDCSFEDVTTIIMPRMEDMFIKYLGFNDKVTEHLKAVAEAQKRTSVPVQPAPVVPQTPMQPASVIPTTTNITSPSMINAMGVIESSKTVPALTLIKKQIADSVKLTVDEQNILNDIIDKKLVELN